MMRWILPVVLLLMSPVLAAPGEEASPLIVHEWGTFTSLQDVDGRTIGGVNIDDEKLPAFVHRLGQPRPGEAPLAIDIFSKSLYAGSPSVTMRLETPVIYFYPPSGEPMTLDVTATFNGGLLSEFYPDGETTLDGKPSRRSPESINGKTRGSITWKDVRLNTRQAPPATDAHVWLAPRNVPAAASIQVGSEAEKYIFYRGVGHFDAPLTVRRSDGNRVSISPAAGFRSDAMWLADFRADGAAAFRRVDLGEHSAAFADADYTADNVAKLRAAMKQSLVSAGLFDDEAEAMLETWKLSYFKSAGQRLFFMVPQNWTDDVLPLEFSRPVKVTRVMIGRIELVTPSQRELTTRLTDPAVKLDEATKQALMQKLGRFAQPLVSDVQRQRNRSVFELSEAKSSIE